MKNLFLLGTVLSGLSSAFTLASSEPANNMLFFTMKAISKDVTYVVFPAKQESPLDVTEEALVTAIARARTAAFQLQLVIEKREGEMIPAVAAELPESEKKAKLDLYAMHLQKAIDQVKIAENQLLTEHAKQDPAARDFRPLASTLKTLDQVIKDAHAVFKPRV